MTRSCRPLQPNLLKSALFQKEIFPAAIGERKSRGGRLLVTYKEGWDTFARPIMIQFIVIIAKYSNPKARVFNLD